MVSALPELQGDPPRLNRTIWHARDSPSAGTQGGWSGSEGWLRPGAIFLSYPSEGEKRHNFLSHVLGGCAEEGKLQAHPIFTFFRPLLKAGCCGEGPSILFWAVQG